MIVVSDSGPLISLMKAGQLRLLKELYGEIFLPEAVYFEVTTNPRYNDEAEQIKNASFIRKVSVANRQYVEMLRRVTGLDLGESEAIVYATANKSSVLLIEDAAGRKVAKQMQLHVRGSIGILLFAFDENLLTAQDVITATDKMRQAGRRISQKLYDYAQAYVRGHRLLL